MLQPSEFHYRLYLARKALSTPGYTVPAGFAVTGSILSFLVEPTLPLFGLIATAAGMNVGLEAAVLRFPADLRPRFRNWFFRYHVLRGLNPANSGIVLTGSSVDPDFILASLVQIHREKLHTALFQQFAGDIDTAFVRTEQMIEMARTTHDALRLKQITRSIQEETQRIARSRDAYLDAMATVYSEPEATEPEDLGAEAVRPASTSVDSTALRPQAPDNASVENRPPAPYWKPSVPSEEEKPPQIRRRDA